MAQSWLPSHVVVRRSLAVAYQDPVGILMLGNGSPAAGFGTPVLPQPLPYPLAVQQDHLRGSDMERRLELLRKDIQAQRQELVALVAPLGAGEKQLAAAKEAGVASDAALLALRTLHENSLETIRSSDRVIDALKLLIQRDGKDDAVKLRTLQELQNIIEKNRVNLEANAVALNAVNALAFTDPLTGLPNRRLLGDRLRQMVLNNRRFDTYSAAIYIDLDKFKHLNDEFGHECGDQLLVAVGQRLKLAVRASDTVARYGGDEFVILLDRLTGSLIDARAETEMIVNKIASHLQPAYPLRVHAAADGERTIDYAIFASMGVAMFAGDPAEEARILDWADEAMYWAKNEGGRSYRFYDAVSSIEATLTRLYALATDNDSETSGHGLRTRQYVKALAKRSQAMNLYPEALSEELIQRMYKTTQLHDIGKSKIDYAVLHKSAALTPEEWQVMKTHTTHGRMILEEARRSSDSLDALLNTAIDIAEAHHEWWDGSGYPKGLAAHDIPLPGRLMCIADVYDALISKRAYKDAWSHELACQTIIANSGRQFDPYLIEAFKKEQDSFRLIAESIKD